MTSMKMIIGWFILIVGFFLLGIMINQYLFKESRPVSPIPNSDEVKVIQITPKDNE